jgi:hypothetical protein
MGNLRACDKAGPRDVPNGTQVRPAWQSRPAQRRRRHTSQHNCAWSLARSSSGSANGAIHSSLGQRPRNFAGDLRAESPSHLPVPNPPFVAGHSTRTLGKRLRHEMNRAFSPGASLSRIPGPLAQAGIERAFGPPSPPDHILAKSLKTCVVRYGEDAAAIGLTARAGRPSPTPRASPSAAPLLPAVAPGRRPFPRSRGRG